MKNIRICLAIDDNYIPPCLVTINSILVNRNLDEYIEFYILTTGLLTSNKNIIKQITDSHPNVLLSFIDVDKNLFKKYYTNTWGLATAYRLRAASIFKDFDKILYLDSDICVMSSLWTLYSTNIENAYGALVPDIWQKTQKRRFLDKKQTYFNSGVFLINLKKWREDDIEIQLDAYYDKNKDNIKYPDQDPINVVLDGKIVELSYKYNFVYSPIKNECRMFEDYKKAAENPTIIHYVFNKPWTTSLYDFKDDIYVSFYFEQIELFPENIKELCLKYHKKYVVKKFKYKLFDFILLMKIKEYTTCKKWYLFGLIPIITEIKYKNN